MRFPALLLVLLVTLAGCRDAALHSADLPAMSGVSDARAAVVLDAYRADLDALAADLDTLHAVAARHYAAGATETTWADVRAAFQQARLRYKATEVLTAHLFPEAADQLNGPALPFVDAYDPTMKVIPPEGFQVVEELVYAGPADTEAAVLLGEVQRTRRLVTRVQQYAAQNALADRHVFEGARLALVRLLALGLAGFDAPVAWEGLAEGAATLDAVAAALAPYGADLDAAVPGLRDTLDARLAAAAAELRDDAQTFETFDRLAFVRTHLNPLAEDLLAAQTALGVPGPPVAKALRADFTTVFSLAAFNVDFFAMPGAGATTPEKVALGKLLFHETALSADGSRSCATCHVPALAFTDGRARAAALVPSAPGADTLRNTPTMINAGLQAASAYDLSTQSVEGRVEAVLVSAHELGLPLEAAAARLRTSDGYRDRFARAFGAVPESDRALGRQVQYALGAYVRSLSRLDSPFDRYARGETDSLSAAAQRGFTLFMGKALCGTCHFAPLFNGTVPPAYAEHEAEVLGVPSRAVVADAAVSPDAGKYNLYRIEKDRHAFKTPTVRNAALTAPYMHNGVYATLEEVVDFYDRGGGAGIGVDLTYQTLPPAPLGLTEREKADLVAFMEALTDTSHTATPVGPRPDVPAMRPLTAAR